MAAKLTLGPVLFNWDPIDWRDFHYRMADEAPIDTVCVGEVVCAKRAPYLAPHLADICERYVNAGKEIVHSTPALMMSTAERGLTRAAVEAADAFLVEANDVGALGKLAGRPHAVGPTVNVYNEDTLAVLARQGAVRVCLTPELKARDIAALATAAAELEPAPALEVTVFGRVPLALSARCYHARAHKRPKDDCGFVCAEDPDGLPVETLDEQAFVVVNGTQLLSATYLDLLGEIPMLRAVGVERFRLMPHACDMVAVANTIRGLLDSTIGLEEARAGLRAELDRVVFSNGFVRGREGAAFESAEAR